MQINNLSIEKILAGLGIESLNEMQLASLKANEENENVILLSSTGSGKTLAFLLPLVQWLKKSISKTQALVIVPSRELALQIDEVFRKMSTGYKVVCCYGGHKREIEENSLVETPAVIIGTAGRLADHIRRENILTDGIQTLVLDEFDKSIEYGFLDEMEFILSKLNSLSKRVLTSATDASSIPDFVGLSNPFTVNFLENTIEKPIGDDLVIYKTDSPDKDKIPTLFKLLCHVNNKSTIVFCNHRTEVESINEYLKSHGLVSVFYHGGMEQQERESALTKFKNGTSNILITTDLASRGLDIKDIKYVVHFHLPGTEEIYTHRNGRTARMLAGGKVVLLLGPEETIPSYIPPSTIETLDLNLDYPVPEKPTWSTLFIAAGKKDKVNKIDIVGFLLKNGQLKKDDLGLVEVKDFYSFAAIRRLKIGRAVELVKNEKIKNKKVKIAVAK